MIHGIWNITHLENLYVVRPQILYALQEQIGELIAQMDDIVNGVAHIMGRIAVTPKLLDNLSLDDRQKLQEAIEKLRSDICTYIEICIFKAFYSFSEVILLYLLYTYSLYGPSQTYRKAINLMLYGLLF